MPLHLKKKEPETELHSTPEAISEAKISLHSYYCQRRSSEERRLQQDDSLDREETYLHSVLQTASEAHNRAYILVALPKQSGGERRLHHTESHKREKA